jgi:AcrR family transcriptional regulator
MPAAERREQLLDAALDVIGERGYGGVTMEEIALRAGVTKPVVYDIFANRGELLMALLEREEARALSLLAEVLPDTASQEDPDTLIVDGFRAFLESVAENPTTWRLIVMPADGTPEVVREHVEVGRAGVRGRLEEVLAWGIEARGGPAGLDVELAAQSLIALAEHHARLVLTDPQLYTPQRFADFIGSLLSVIGSGERRA